MKMKQSRAKKRTCHFQKITFEACRAAEKKLLEKKLLVGTYWKDAALINTTMPLFCEELNVKCTTRNIDTIRRIFFKSFHTTNRKKFKCKVSSGSDSEYDDFLDLIKMVKEGRGIPPDGDNDEYLELSKMAEENQYIVELAYLPFRICTWDKEILNSFIKGNFSRTIHLDATGSTVKYADAEDRVLIYDVLAFHTASRKYISIAHMVSDSHTTLAINTFLNSFRYALEELSVYDFKDSINRVITDKNFALVGGVIRAFNDYQHTVTHYIESCYHTIQNKLDSVDFTVIQFCHYHWMHLVEKDLHKYRVDKAPSQLVIKLMTMACRLTDFYEIEKWYKAVISITFPAKQIPMIDRALMEVADWMVDPDNTSDDTSEFDGATDLIEIESLRNTPFSLHFHQIFESVTAEILKEESKHSTIPKKYCCKEFLIEKIVGMYSPIVPFWTNIMGKYVDDSISVSNAPTKNWFRVLKHNILSHLDMKPAMYLKERQEYMVSRYTEIVENNYSTVKGISTITENVSNLPTEFRE